LFFSSPPKPNTTNKLHTQSNTQNTNKYYVTLGYTRPSHTPFPFAPVGYTRPSHAQVLSPSPEHKFLSRNCKWRCSSKTLNKEQRKENKEQRTCLSWLHRTSDVLQRKRTKSTNNTKNTIIIKL
jgi:hypothetical protein